jgi:hypothetical protein
MKLHLGILSARKVFGAAMMINGIDKAIAKIRSVHGRPSRVAKACGVDRRAVQQWKRVPGHHVLTVAPMIGLSPEEIRPDIFKAKRMTRKT